MQSSFRRNLILVSEAVFAFLTLNIIQFLLGISNPVILGFIIISFAFVFFITTYIFLKRGEKITKVLKINIQTELAG